MKKIYTEEEKQAAINNLLETVAPQLKKERLKREKMKLSNLKSNEKPAFTGYFIPMDLGGRNMNMPVPADNVYRNAYNTSVVYAVINDLIKILDGDVFPVGKESEYSFYDEDLDNIRILDQNEVFTNGEEVVAIVYGGTGGFSVYREIERE